MENIWNSKSNILDLCKKYEYDIIIDELCISIKKKNFFDNKIQLNDNVNDTDNKALLITGLCRYSNRCVHSIKKFIENYKNLHVSCTFWDITGHKNKETREYLKSRPRVWKGYLNNNWFDMEIINIDILENIIINLKPVSIQFYNYIKHESSYFIPKIKSMDTLIHTYRDTKMILSRTFLLKQGFNILYNINQQKHYSYFFNIRLDMMINSKINLKEVKNCIATSWGGWVSTSKKEVVFAGAKITPTICDIMCITDNIEYFKSYCLMYDNIDNLKKTVNSISKFSYNYESLLGFYIKYMCKIKVKELMVKCCLERTFGILLLDFDLFDYKSCAISKAHYEKLENENPDYEGISKKYGEWLVEKGKRKK